MIIKIDPFTRIRDRWTKHPILSNTYTEIENEFSYSNFTDNYSIDDADSTLFQSAFLHVVTETVFDYPNIFVSEKSFKPIINKRPFVLVSTAGCLKNLQNFGFRTFNDYWDENYDNIENPDTRMFAIFDIIQNICSKSIVELQSMNKSMEEILEYNFNHYRYNFKNQELEKFEQECIKNLGIR